jgi:DNA-3-methyladenine glycosylase II
MSFNQHKLLPLAEQHLATQDPILMTIIRSQTARWPTRATENSIGGLIRIVMAQQISTAVACRLAERVRSEHPLLLSPSPRAIPDPRALRALGLPLRRAECCAQIVERSEEILVKVAHGSPWEEALAGIKGIGPWTIDVFRIMVLREPDVLPLGDAGLKRAVQNVYGRRRNIERLSKRWRPFRSVACWYLWRTLGNQQLG